MLFVCTETFRAAAKCFSGHKKVFFLSHWAAVQTLLYVPHARLSGVNLSAHHKDDAFYNCRIVNHVSKQPRYVFNFSNVFLQKESGGSKILKMKWQELSDLFSILCVLLFVNVSHDYEFEFEASSSHSGSSTSPRKRLYTSKGRASRFYPFLRVRQILQMFITSLLHSLLPQEYELIRG